MVSESDSSLQHGDSEAGFSACLRDTHWWRRPLAYGANRISKALACAALMSSLAWSPSGLAAPAAVPDDAPLRMHVQQLDTSSYPEITCYLSVAEQDKPVLGLTKGEISLAVDGKKLDAYTLRSVTENGSQIAVALAIDTSGSMKGAPIAAAQGAADEFAGRLSESDLAGLITFGGGSRVACELTPDREKLRSAVEGTAARGNTALYDAVLLGLDQLAGQPSPRKALLVLTDGKDTESKASREDCLVQAGNSGVPIFSIGLGAEVNEDVVEALAGESGGESFLTTASGELLGIYQQIAEQLNSQYVLTYRDPPPAPDEGPWREAVIAVQYGGRAASASRKYLRVIDPDTMPPKRGPSPVLVGVIIVTGLDMLLLAAWLLRRRAGAGLRG